MNVLTVFGIAVCAFWPASRIYSRYLARWLGEDPARPTPAVERNDGRGCLAYMEDFFPPP